MARATRDSKLETRSARARLPKKSSPYWRLIGQGLHLGYYNNGASGRWVARWYAGDKKYKSKVVGAADDHRDANGVDVLSYFQAQDEARRLADEAAKLNAGKPLGPYTVADAMTDYLEWYKHNRKAYETTEATVEGHILPTLGKKEVSKLTTGEIRKWLNDLTKRHARLRGKKTRDEDLSDPEIIRKRKATANRVLTVLKAALNHAWHEGKVADDSAWRRVKPFGGVNTPHIRYLTKDEYTRLLNACDPDFRPLVHAALHSGCRWGELTRLRVADYNPDAGTLHVREAKGGKPRHIPLTQAGQRFFERLCAGRKGDALMFVNADGNGWGRSHQTRPMREASERAEINPAATFHILRHTYASALALKGVPLQVIATALGHADTRITERHYAHLQPDFVADTIRAALPDFGSEVDNVAVLRPSKRTEKAG